jgi:hypothetical protein
MTDFLAAPSLRHAGVAQMIVQKRTKQLSERAPTG